MSSLVFYWVFDDYVESQMQPEVCAVLYLLEALGNPFLIVGREASCNIRHSGIDD